MQVPYEVRPSPLGGRGLFATADIPAGTLLWKYSEESVHFHDEASLRAKLATMTKEDAKELLEHIYCWEGKACDIQDDGRLWNHTRRGGAACNTGPDPSGGDEDSSYAIRDIKANEELLDDYGTYERLPWFETLCREYGAESCIVIGETY
eukprot:TRINITY_DN3795_c0_g1_i1.p2 TRINITY_DN3795_c0_g1~~TRINITY_DN3795_c0_g1_i1.p2  ORF type:complete len:150 (+),score=41.91 TRINITY_DN3795_c0_g1_i1:52-501(+)